MPIHRAKANIFYTPYNKVVIGETFEPSLFKTEVLDELISKGSIEVIPDPPKPKAPSRKATPKPPIEE